MPPAHLPAQALVTSQPFSDDCHPTLNLTYAVLSLSFVFVSGLFLTFRSIIRRRHPINDNAHPCTTFSLPTLLSNEEWRVRPVRKRASLAPTVSTLAAHSTIVASSPLHLNLISEVGSPPTLGGSIDSLNRDLDQSLSRGKATIGFASRAASAPAALIQQSFSGFIRLLSSSPTALSDSDCSSHGHNDSGLLRKSRVLGFFSNLRRQPNRSNGKEHAGPHQHLSDVTDPVDTEEPEPDIRVLDIADIPQMLHSIHSIDSAQFMTETPMIPLIILSLPSSDHLVEDAPPPASVDEDLLSPDGTFRSTGLLAWATVDKHDLSDATHPVLASRLRERRKRPMSLPSHNVLSTPGMAYWPRWF